MIILFIDLFILLYASLIHKQYLNNEIVQSRMRKISNKVFCSCSNEKPRKITHITHPKSLLLKETRIYWIVYLWNFILSKYQNNIVTREDILKYYQISFLIFTEGKLFCIEMATSFYGKYLEVSLSWIYQLLNLRYGGLDA